MKRLLTILLVVLMPAMAMAQGGYKIGAKSNIKVSGTSTMHDWTMTSEALQGNIILNEQAGKISGIKQAQLKLNAESLKSGKDAMDKNAYKALKTNKHQNIQFELSSLKSLEPANGGYKAIANGKVTIAGVSKAETIEVLLKPDGKGGFTCQGSKALKMSEYGVEPPSFMFGSVTTGDAITISFNLNLNAAPELVTK